MKGHVCADIDSFPLDKFHQLGQGRGKKLLIVGESPAPNGWVISGRACYKPDGKILPTGKRINELLAPLQLSVENSGFTELIKCFVSTRAELPKCGAKCWSLFLKQISSQDYKLLVILGVKTTEILNNLLGKELAIGEFTALNLESREYIVLPIYHPSPVNPTGHKKNLEIFAQLHEQLADILK